MRLSSDNKARTNTKLPALENKGKIRIALAGNPNSGKTSIFNALTGESQHVGNYPGVTVEKKVGKIERDGRFIEIIDLPGTYSLTAFSIEEIVTRDFVLREKPDIIIDIIDSTNLERNLYLCLQFQELGVPIVGALNMTDEAIRNGILIDEYQLGIILGIPFVKTIGSRGKGVDELLQAALNLADGVIEPSTRKLNYGLELESQISSLISVLRTDQEFVSRYPLHWMAIKLLENDTDAVDRIKRRHQNSQAVLDAAEKSRLWVSRHFGEDPEVVVSEQRYAYIHGACKEVVKIDSSSSRIDYTESIDRIILNKYLGLIIFLGIMFLIYHITFSVGNPISGMIDYFFSLVNDLITHSLSEGILRDFLTEAIISGVGGVLVFFPIVILLFLGLSFLEDTGYMARAAFVMDKFMHIFGLHGRSFIPMMISTGCAVPGVMSARTLVNPKDRVLTILVSPLMMCGAKTPVIAMLASAFFAHRAGIVFWSIWFLGWVVALIIAKIFRLTYYRGEASPFVMELPPYRVPTLRGVLTHVWEKSWTYVKKAGTFILAASIVIWFFLYFPRPQKQIDDYHRRVMSLKQTYEVQASHSKNSEERTRLRLDYQHQLTEMENKLATEKLRHSYGGRLGNFIEPVFKPCGFDWRMDIALIAGFAAKEVIISTMGIVYGIGTMHDDEIPDLHGTATLKEKLRNDPMYNARNVLALMIFILLYVPCIATLAVVKKELGKWKYPIFLAGYTLVIAWLMATLIYQFSAILPIGG
ncbi:ferrous iron transport protein B [candidate division KSB1 bacterium]|nr:ferrous iron transport protein B [candidate division KSB1 bacterium]